jgi:UDP-GlcNAc:undecaprenyl-phosphate GlcNAc-1-phosphate transferase
MLWGLAAVSSFVVAFVAVRLLAGRFAGFALDRPNERSLHERPVPRTGGIAVLAGTATAVVFLEGAYWLPLALALVLAALSLVDDLRDMPTPVRLIGHLTAAAVLVGNALWPGHPLEVVLLVLAITWITNLYNFMDGSDGLAGGMTLIGFATYALAAYLAGNLVLAVLCIAIAAAAAAFLAHNFPPARIFLGDVGSIPLGFLAGALGVLGWRGGLWPLWFPVLVFGPFIGDATVTLVRRLLRRERVWQAHRDHYYQRLVRMGFGHRGTALIGYVVMAGCAGMALFGRTQPLIIQIFAFLAAAAALGVLAAWIDLRWARFNQAA